MVPFDMQLPEKVRQFRRKHYSVRRVAELIRVAPSTVYRLEKDPLCVKGSTLNAYLRAMGCRLRVVY